LFRGGELIYPEYSICIVNCVVEVILSEVLPLVDSLRGHGNKNVTIVCYRKIKSSILWFLHTTV